MHRCTTIQKNMPKFPALVSSPQFGRGTTNAPEANRYWNIVHLNAAPTAINSTESKREMRRRQHKCFKF
jgi:hypothetical protein